LKTAWRRWPRIVCGVDVAREAHGHAPRSLTEERVRLSVVAVLVKHLGSGRQKSDDARPSDKADACALALGLQG
jgi:hypothetical protein